jgi:hypothetical protein
MRALSEILTQMHPGIDLRFFFLTRAADAWLASCHAQHLHVVRMVMDAATYAEAHRASADLDAVVDAVSETVSPVPVSRCALEHSSARPLGPLDPLLDLLDLPGILRARIVSRPVANSRHDATILDALLIANRDHADPEARKTAKRLILSAARTRGRHRP